MQVEDLKYSNLTVDALATYKNRAKNESGQFLIWFLENIFRLDPQDADDACVDSTMDKGVDGIFTDEGTDTIYVVQCKIRQSDTAELGDKDLQSFAGALEQFQSPETIKGLIEGSANEKLKSALKRHDVAGKLAAGYSLRAIFCCHMVANEDAHEYLKAAPQIDLYDSERIAAEHVELDGEQGISGEFTFDVSDTDLISYATSNGVRSFFFLANGLQLTHLQGISDQSLFSRNLRHGLGNTKVNKALISGIRNQPEHTNFPLYHNGITLLCDQAAHEPGATLTVTNYTVVNGAQSLNSLLSTKSRISESLRILVRVVESGADNVLSEKITQNSNNQNSIKARDQKSNVPVQKRIKKEVAALEDGHFVYEVKQGEINPDNLVVINNELAGLAVLSVDLAEPWSCHQRYKVMGDSHAKIFARPSMTGAKVVALHQAVSALSEVLDDFDDKVFGHYSLTKYFLALCVSEILRTDPSGKALLERAGDILKASKLPEFVDLFKKLAATTVHDIDAEVETSEGEVFDYKTDLKSPKWCRETSAKIRAAYLKDVKRKKAQAIEELVSPLLKSL